MMMSEEQLKDWLEKRRAAAKLRHETCKNEGCENKRANGSSRCVPCSEKHKVAV